MISYNSFLFGMIFTSENYLIKINMHEDCKWCCWF